MISIVVQVLRLQAQTAELRGESMQWTPIVDLGISISCIFAVAPNVQRDFGDHDDDGGKSWKDEERWDEKETMAGFVVAENDFL